MSGAQHTPGPWRCIKTQDNVIVNEGGDKWIARALIGNKRSPRFHADPDIAAANACLIAAAPDLLAALKQMASLAETAPAAGPQASADAADVAWAQIEKARAAIAKAEGKP